MFFVGSGSLVTIFWRYWLVVVKSIPLILVLATCTVWGNNEFRIRSSDTRVGCAVVGELGSA